MRASEIIERLKAHGGVSTTGALAPTRQERRTLNSLVASGVVLKISHGWFCLPDTPDEIRLAYLTRAKITCVSALELLGLRTLSKSKRVHLAKSTNQGIKLPHHIARHVVIHREPDNWATTISASPSPPLQTPLAPWPAIFARVAVCQPLREAVVALDSGLNSGLAQKDEIARLLHPPLHVNALRALDLASPTSQSVLESLARLELVTAGLKVQPQALISPVGYVDLLVEDFIVVELDGFSYHGDRSQFLRDRFRDRELAKLNYRVLRFAYDEVIDRPEFVVEEVRRLLEARQLTLVRS